MRLAELGGGTPRRRRRMPMPFHPLNRHLLAGKKLHHRIVQENDRRRLFLLLSAGAVHHLGVRDRGGQATVYPERRRCGGRRLFAFADRCCRSLRVQTYIVGITVKCVELFAPLFMSAVESSCGYLRKTSRGRGCQMLTRTANNSWTVFSARALSCFAQTRCAASGMISTSSIGHGSESGILGLGGGGACLEPVVSVNLQSAASRCGGATSIGRALLSEFTDSQQQDHPSSLKAWHCVRSR